MKRLLLVGCLSCLLLLTLSACSRSTEASENDNIVYGQVVKTDENQITIESGDYTYGGSFEGDGCEKSYNLPENVFYDDFKAGDIVSILCDGRDATAVANVKDVNHRRSSGSGSDPGSENSGSDAASGFGQAVLTGADAAQLSADDEPVAVNDDNYEVQEDGQIGILALNSGGKITMRRSSVAVMGRNSCGITAANGASIDGEQVNLSTSGENAAAAATLDLTSVIDLSDSTMETAASGSPCVISAGNISLTGVSATVQKSSGVAVLPGGVVNLKNSSMVSHGDAAVKLCNIPDLQDDREAYTESGSRSSGSSEGQDSGIEKAFSSSTQSGKAKFMADGSSIEAVSNKALVQVTGIEGLVKMMNTDLASANRVLADVRADEQKNGGKLLLYGVNQKYSGDITCDKSSKVKLVLTEGSSYSGAFDAKGAAAYSKVYLSRNSAWNVTGDSHIDSLRNGDKKCRNIKSNGHTVYYDKNREANDWLGGKTLSLPGGGTLQPE